MRDNGIFNLRVVLDDI